MIGKRYAWTHGGRRRRSGPAGQALTELALVLPILALLFVGVLDLGRAFHTTVALSNAARVGVIFGQQVETPSTQASCGSGTTVCGHISANDIITATINEAQGGIKLGPSNVQVCLGTYQRAHSGICPIPSSDLNFPVSPDDNITVTVTITSFKTITPLVHVGSISGSVTGHSFRY